MRKTSFFIGFVSKPKSGRAQIPSEQQRSVIYANGQRPTLSVELGNLRWTLGVQRFLHVVSILPPGFGDANVSTQGNQSDWRDRRRQSKNQPHRSGMSRAVFRTKRSQQPATGADQEFTYEEWQIRERAVRRLLPLRCNRGGILVHTRRIERFSDREHDQIKRSHDVVGVNAPVKTEVAVPEPLSDHAVGGGLEPFRRQSHDEYSGGADRSTDHHHPISCKLLRQRAYDRHQKDNHDCVDIREFSDRSVQAELANPELRKHVIHLQKDGFEKSDQEEKNKYPVEAGLTDKPPKEVCRVDRTFPHHFYDAAPKGGGSPACPL